jgi:hypothetical protein
MLSEFQGFCFNANREEIVPKALNGAAPKLLPIAVRENTAHDFFSMI